MIDRDDRALQTAAPRETEVAASPQQHADELDRSDTALVETDLLVEDVSIDGMCGVY